LGDGPELFRVPDHIVQSASSLSLPASLLEQIGQPLAGVQQGLQRGDLLDDVLGLEILSFLNCSSTPSWVPSSLEPVVHLDLQAGVHPLETSLKLSRSM